MRIGVNALYLIPGTVGGTESYLRNLLRAFEQLAPEDEFVVFTNEENAGTFSLTAPNFTEVRCPVRAVNRTQRIVWEQLALPVQAARAGIDVLHSPGYTAPLMQRGAGVVTIHDLNYHYFPEDWSPAALWANRLLIPSVAHTATRIITVSHSSARAITEVLGIAADKIDVVHHGVDGNLQPAIAGEEQKVRERYGLKGRFLLSVTASHPHKNLDGLLRAYQLACSDWRDPPPLVIVGVKGRHQEQLERALAQQAGPGRIILTGWIEPADLGALYRSAHLLVFPSKYEGFGFPVLEAMSSDLPVVSSFATSLAEIIGDAGVLFDPTDDRAMADAIRSTWDDEPRRRDLIERGRAQAATFTWRRAAEQTLASYRRAGGVHERAGHQPRERRTY